MVIDEVRKECITVFADEIVICSESKEQVEESLEVEVCSGEKQNSSGQLSKATDRAK